MHTTFNRTKQTTTTFNKGSIFSIHRPCSQGPFAGPTGEGRSHGAGPFSGHLFFFFPFSSPPPSHHQKHLVLPCTGSGGLAAPPKCNGNGKKETLGRPELDASPLPAKRPWGGTKRKCRNIKPVLWALHLEAVPLPWPLYLAKSRL